MCPRVGVDGEDGGIKPLQVVWGQLVRSLTSAACSMPAVPAVFTHGPVPHPHCPRERLVPGTDGPQCQGFQICLAGPLPALLPPASTQCLEADGTHGGARVGCISVGLLGHLAVPMGTGTRALGARDGLQAPSTSVFSPGLAGLPV